MRGVQQTMFPPRAVLLGGSCGLLCGTGNTHDAVGALLICILHQHAVLCCAVPSLVLLPVLCAARSATGVTSTSAVHTCWRQSASCWSTSATTRTFQRSSPSPSACQLCRWVVLLWCGKLSAHVCVCVLSLVCGVCILCTTCLVDACVCCHCMLPYQHMNSSACRVCVLCCAGHAAGVCAGRLQAAAGPLRRAAVP